MKKMMFAFMLTVMASSAFAQVRGGIGGDRGGVIGRGGGHNQVTCTIFTRQKGAVTGVGRDCYAAISDAQNICAQIIKRENEKRCFNAGRIPDAMFSISCTDLRGRGACTNVLPYSF